MKFSAFSNTQYAPRCALVVVRMQEQTIKPSNELPSIEETENKTYVVSLQDLDKRCSNIELQVSKILEKFDGLEKHVKVD